MRDHFVRAYIIYDSYYNGNVKTYLLSFSIVSGSDAVLLGAETLRGLYPVDTISVVGKICAEVNFILFSSSLLISITIKFVTSPLSLPPN